MRLFEFAKQEYPHAYGRTPVLPGPALPGVNAVVVVGRVVSTASSSSGSRKPVAALTDATELALENVELEYFIIDTYFDSV